MSADAGRPQRGGAGRGQGRKPLPLDVVTKPCTVRLDAARWAKLKQLGTDWLRQQIDAAKEAA